MKQLNVTSGVYLTQIEPKGPAEGAGLRAGDVILKVDGHLISDSQTLMRAVAGVRAGTTVVVTLQRDGKSKDVQVKLGERPTPPGN
jgi:serine protease Do